MNVVTPAVTILLGIIIIMNMQNGKFVRGGSIQTWIKPSPTGKVVHPVSFSYSTFIGPFGGFRESVKHSYKSSDVVEAISVSELPIEQSLSEIGTTENQSRSSASDNHKIDTASIVGRTSRPISPTANLRLTSAHSSNEMTDHQEAVEGWSPVVGHNAGSALVGLAQQAAGKDNSAITNQQATAAQAVVAAKIQQAQNAAASAAISQVALNAKLSLLKLLQQQYGDLKSQLHSEAQQLNQAQTSAHTAAEALRRSEKQVTSLRLAVSNAQSSYDQSLKTYQLANAEAGSQAAMVSTIKQKLIQVESQLASSQAELGATQAASGRAALAAHTAKSTPSTNHSQMQSTNIIVATSFQTPLSEKPLTYTQ